MCKEENRIPLLGESFPEVSVKTTFGTMNLPADMKGKWFILFSHPGDFTPVCTTEFVAFNKRLDEFKALNCELIGLSIDQVQSHLKWTEWIGEKTGKKIGFPVIADELGKLAKKLGMLHPAKGTSTVRAVFIVDPEGKLRIMIYFPPEIGRSVNEILRALKALQISDKMNVAAPENYPNNEWLGEGKLIIPPATNQKMIDERKNMAEKGDVTMLDWWLCYK